MITVVRWVNEDGKRTRKWYWQVTWQGAVVRAGLTATEPTARDAAENALADVAYRAGVIATEMGAAS